MFSIYVNCQCQYIELRDGNSTVFQLPVSTSTKGLGEAIGSEKTPRGRHRIAAMIGGGMPEQTVFVGREPTGEMLSAELRSREPDRDWIVSRILWLEGLDEGVNSGGEVDTFSRFIYIHGTAEVERLGVPCSHGCIRMRPEDIMLLYDKVKIGCNVLIE